MNPIKQCYLAYRHEAQDAVALNKVLDGAKEMLPCKEYAALEAGINEYCEETFATGFRFAVRLLADGMR